MTPPLTIGSLTIGSLFSGIGGLELGVEHATGARTLWQVERESFCRDVLAKHWPDAVRYDDVRTVGAELAPVDIICGGFPCQDVSLAGKRAGFAGERSSLWREYRRLIALLRPRYVFAENVPGLLTARGGADFAEVLGDLAALGFDAEWATFRASDVGAPHKRERLFVLAYRRGASRVGREPERLPRSALPPFALCAGAGAVADAASEPRRGLSERAIAQESIARVAGGGERGVGLADSDGARLPQREDRARHLGEDERAAAQRGGRGDAALADAHRLGERQPQYEAVSLARSGDAREGACGRGGRVALPGVGDGADGLPGGLARRDPDAHRWPAGRGEAQHEGEPPRTSKHVPQRAAKLKALGNAVVRQQAALAWRVLYARACAGPDVAEAGPATSQMSLFTIGGAA